MPALTYGGRPAVNSAAGSGDPSPNLRGWETRRTEYPRLNLGTQVV